MALLRFVADRRPARLGGVPIALIALVALATLAACEVVPLPILRGTGNEHRQAVAVGLPF